MAEPISLQDCRDQLRLGTDTSDDPLIGSLITAAREHCEAATGLVLTPREIVETAAALGRWIDLASWPVSAITSISVLGVGGVLQVLDPSAWYVSLPTRPVRILPASPFFAMPALFWANPQPVTITLQAGFATPDDVPQVVKQAMLLLVQHWYDNRSSAEVGARAAAIEIPFGVEVLLRRWRMPVI